MGGILAGYLLLTRPEEWARVRETVREVVDAAPRIAVIGRGHRSQASARALSPVIPSAARDLPELARDSPALAPGTTSAPSGSHRCPNRSSAPLDFPDAGIPSAPLRSSSASSASPTATSSPWTASTSRSVPASASACSGPTAPGKTTTIEICEGLTPPDSGEVAVLGRRWGRDDRALRELLGISLQETQFSEKLTVDETVRLFRSFYRRGPSADEVIDMVQLGEKAGARVGQLSGGQKQRLALACALVGDPELLFLDEPTTGLDPQSRRQLWELIERFRAGGRSILLTTHYMEEAERLCDRVAIVDHGRMIALGTPRELIASLGAEHVLEFAVADGARLDAAALRRRGRRRRTAPAGRHLAAPGLRAAPGHARPAGRAAPPGRAAVRAPHPLGHAGGRLRLAHREAAA